MNLITDLALILIVAGIVILLFKKLKQPLVLGYIVAGFLVSPNMPYTMSVVDKANIHTWADIGVMFLLFSLGLDFSFKKILKMGMAPIIASLTIIFCMASLGMFVGHTFGWSKMDCIFLGGMLAMSSTTIIYKAFDDLGLTQQRFAGLVMSVLILEDILAIVMMVMLGAIADGGNPNGSEMLNSIMRIGFFLILWFVVGLFIVPLFLRTTRRLMNDETMIIVALGLCCLMAVISTKVGFSSAFGAFVMGSILAETLEAERIESLVSPVKDLFGAIFFVSVGMMVDPMMLIEYWKPIVAITAAILIGQSVLGTGSYLLSGQTLKVAIRSGFSMAQIGEFAFIIASLGVSLGVTSHFLYPVVVAVSVITTFITPYMIKASNPAYDVAVRYMPSKIANLIDNYTSGGTLLIRHKNNWNRLLKSILRVTVVYIVLSVATILLAFHVLLPFLSELMPFRYARWTVAVLTLLCIAPFIRAMIAKKNRSEEFKALWNDSRLNIAPLVMLVAARVLIALAMVVYVIGHLFGYSMSFSIAVGLVLIFAMYSSKKLQERSIQLEKTFFNNLHSRERYAEAMGQKKGSYLTQLMSDELHLASVSLPENSCWEGMTLKELDLGNKFNISVASVIRGSIRINIPVALTRLYPHDKLEVIGTDEQLTKFIEAMNADVFENEEFDIDDREMKLVEFVITAESVFAGKSISQSGIKAKYHCLIVGIEVDGQIQMPNRDTVLSEGSVVWAVGENADVERLPDLRA